MPRIFPAPARLKLFMKKLTAALALTFVPFIAVGCSSSGSGSVSKSDVQTKTGSFYKDKSHEDAKSVSCDGSLPAKVEATQSCTATAADGQSWPITVKVTKVDGKDVYYDLSFTDAFVGPDDVTSSVSDFYREKVGVAPKSSTCNGLLRGATGATIRCVITESDGTRWGVTAKTTNVEGTKVNYDMIVDDQPLP
ncbi:DUF4333 domain-containing protein [Nocardia seriolae]|nr:DUF4333 domain-containing protein [Nocardia seriolae]MTJ63059.1 DUF4333 domain-containing protein [Nocardia seriolae]MTJ73292.1 DUF4333 domain-containing protein [Nocardia seriolae]MTJ89134.1 DUF4333 domain-containing protein [Nocardia seriolae]MTK33112.1 DUF4333 domain-containing protein [Nocardia seriolae]MTK40952.1 DUF4333 domain-containing protein [Nocardia seriolae]